MIRLQLPGCPGYPIYLKDESTHPSGSLKHRLARSLFLYGLCNGWIDEHTTIIEASSGSTAVSEAYFARLLGLPFIAVVPAGTSRQKITQIEFYGGRCHLVDDPTQILSESRRLADSLGGHFMDQFTYAERATDWRGNNNIAESLFRQMDLEPVSEPAWIVVGAGTGGTSATLGRYIRYFRRETQLCVVDPEHSVLFDYWRHNTTDVAGCRPSRIEGIGRPSVPASFLTSIIDDMVRVPDCLSLAAMRCLESILARRCGASTGTNLIGVIHCIRRMQAEGRTGPIVSLICDAGDRYHDTYYDAQWCLQQNLDPADQITRVSAFCSSGTWDD